MSRETTYTEALAYLDNYSLKVGDAFYTIEKSFHDLPRGVQTAIIDRLASIRKEGDYERARNKED